MTKGIDLLSLSVMCLFLLTACLSNSPGAAAKKYVGYLQDGNAKAYTEGIAMCEDATAEQKKQAEAMMGAMVEKGKKALDEKGGIKDVEIISETISEDGKTADVVLKITYGNCSVEEDDQLMVLEDGKWKMKIKK